jgi:hypothetical protein
MKEFKNTMKYLDVAVFLLMTVGYIFAQFENEDFYQSNLAERSRKAVMINFMIYNNVTNSTSLDKIKNISMYTIIRNFTNISAEEIHQYSDPSNVSIKLEISAYSNGLRVALLITTAIASTVR